MAFRAEADLIASGGIALRVQAAGTFGWRRISSRAIWLRCASSGPSAMRSGRAVP
jgi:hypothetical protein